MTSLFLLHLERAHIPTPYIPLQSMSHSINFLKTIEPSSVSLPKTIQEVLGHTEWMTATTKEMNALNKNGT